MTEIKISTDKEYTVTIGNGAASFAGKIISAATGSKMALLLSDTTVAPLYGRAVAQSLRSAGIKVYTFTLPSGEQIKNKAMLFDVIDFMFNRDFCRDDLLVTLGGGTVSDLGGLAASLYMRGIKLFHFPTTLLAMVDASVGGKTAIDLPYGKNMVGTFYQPDGVLIDPQFLVSLPQKQVSCGYAEVIKCACLDSKKMFLSLQSGDYDIADVIEECIKIKQDYIEKDEKDVGSRRLLNLGHTYAHALESYSGYRVSHGFAVAIGIANAYRYATQLGKCESKYYTRVCMLLKKFQLPVCSRISGEALYLEALHDKKRRGNTTALVLPSKIGKCSICNADDKMLREFFMTEDKDERV